VTPLILGVEAGRDSGVIMSSGRLVWLGEGWNPTGPDSSGWARGYAFVGEGASLEDDEIATHLVENWERLDATVEAMNGCFAAVIDASPFPVLVTDRYATIPIYVHACEGTTYASSDPWLVVERLESRPELDPVAALDMLRTSYVTGTRTLLRGISTIGPATLARVFHDGPRSVRYWEYGYRPEPLGQDQAEGRLAEILDAVAVRTSRHLESRGYRAALTLSGGLDSRVLASVLSSTSASPFSAISYGSPEDPEVDVAREISNRLGMPHSVANVDSTYLQDDFIRRSVEEVGLTTRFTCGVGARHLESSGIDVMIPGHTGDFISGGHLPAQTGLVRTREQLCQYLALTHFKYGGSEAVLRRVLRADYDDMKWQTLDESTAAFDFSRDIFGLIDRWNVENRQRRMILMELRAYERIARWMLPFYDNELVDFFAMIPHPLRFAQNLYIETARDRIFARGTGDLAHVRRVGSRSMASDPRLARRIAWLQRLQPISGWSLQLGLAGLRDTIRSIRPKPDQRFGTDPIKSWFNERSDVRDYLLERISAIEVDLLDARALAAELESGKGEDRLYTRLLPGALTIQTCMDMSLERWLDARS
jgi:asparagine synthase (glutamine-hydrolysing)